MKKAIAMAMLVGLLAGCAHDRGGTIDDTDSNIAPGTGNANSDTSGTGRGTHGTGTTGTDLLDPGAPPR